MARTARSVLTRIPPLALILIAAGVLRFATLGVQSYWDDEGFTVGLMRQSFHGMLSGVRETESAPPLYYVLAWGWSKAFGVGEAGLRSLSAVFGTATVFAVYWAARNAASRRAALVAAAAVAVNPILIWYSQEARAYALFTLTTAVTLALFVRLLRAGANTRARWLWAAAACVSLSTHYFSLFILVPQFAILVYRLGLRKIAAQLGTIAGMGLILLPLALHQRQKEFGFTQAPILRRIAQVPEQLLVGFGVWADPLGKAAACVSALAVVVGVVLAWRRAAAAARVTLAAVAVVAAFAAGVPIVLSVLGVGLDYVATKYFVGMLVVAAVIVAAGWSVSRVGLAVAALCVAVALAVDVAVVSTPSFQREDLRGASRSISSPCVARAVVVSPSSMLTAYLPDLRELRAGGARVSEIDLVAMPVKAAGRHEVVPRTLRRHIPAPGFRLVQRTNASRFTTVRFRSAVPRLVRPSELAASRIGPWTVDRVTVFWEPCKRHSS